MSGRDPLGRYPAAVKPSAWRWARWLTGGRPMQPIEFRFTDLISGAPVWLFIDTFGRYWLAESRWSFDRMRPTHL